MSNTRDNKNQGVKKVFSRRLAVFLREHGCKIVGTEVNFKRPEFDVWLFEDDDILHEAFELYSRTRGQ
jgi:uncharacterized UPF0146 family protein